mmetsp:Transcript_25604/g.39774  ORF Transcript_25604/g.39774 Transcript_25604/m.39774 type:complete len:80 (-) Transcript_25604:2470-2709(-)
MRTSFLAAALTPIISSSISESAAAAWWWWKGATFLRIKLGIWRFLPHPSHLLGNKEQIHDRTAAAHRAIFPTSPRFHDE